MKLKVGDKLVCKQRCFSNGREIVIGKTIKITKIIENTIISNPWSNGVHTIYFSLSSPNDAWISESSVKEYFYTEKELRKLKIEKLG